MLRLSRHQLGNVTQKTRYFLNNDHKGFSNNVTPQYLLFYAWALHYAERSATMVYNQLYDCMAVAHTCLFGV